MRQTTRIITVAGTKGKTTCVRALQYAMNSVQKEPVLGVDTHRVMLGDNLLMPIEEYTSLFGIGTAVCPGKTLLALAGQKEPIAVLEASISTSRRGLGYYSHEIGIFTNVYEDHIKPGTDISNREELAAAKASYIFRHIGKNGTAIYNADNDLIPTQLGVIPTDRNITRIACTLEDPRKLSANYVATIRDNHIVIMGSEGEELVSVDLLSMPWLHQGKHQPSLYDGMFVIAALWRFYATEPKKFQKALRILNGYLPDQNGARMVVRTAENGAKVIIDFAHERESLKQIAEFARKHVSADGKVIGVVRINNSRDDEHIKHSVEYFAPSYDKLFVYDMADEDGEYGRTLGEVPKIIAGVSQSCHIPAEVVLNHKDALTAAYDESTADTAIIYIIHSPYDALETADSIFHFKRED